MQDPTTGKRVAATESTTVQEFMDALKPTPQQVQSRKALEVLSQRPASQVYQGTADPKAVAARRTKAKAARRSRAKNRAR
jgi:hypothetical protein